MNYNDSLEYLERIYTINSKRNKESLLTVLGMFGMPQNKIKIIHVAGTNGKGSTCAMLSSILTEAGYTVGMFTSPHLESYNERISINGELISNDDLAAEISTVEKAVIEAFGSETGLSFFEIFTVATYNYFYKKQVDYALIEVGLGGRLDCTNVMDSPVLTVITAIGFDHMHILGNTLPEIASEKAGIIKKNRPVVLFTNPEEVYNVVKQKADENSALLYYAKDGIECNVLGKDLRLTTFSARCEYFDYNNIQLSLFGNYQMYNASNTLLCVEALRNEGINLTDDVVLRGLAKTRWAGRMEILSEKPLVIIDGAHNCDGVRSVNETFRDYFKDRRINLVVGILGDKQYKEMIDELSSIANCIIATEANNKRALPAESLAESITGFDKKVIVEKDYEKAFDAAYNMSGNNDVILVVGSLYLLGDLRPYIINKLSKI